MQWTTIEERAVYKGSRKEIVMGGHWVELAIVVLIGLALFGPKTLQSLGRNAGRGIGQAKDIKNKVMSELPMEELHKMSENIPTSPRHAMQILMTPEQKERVKAATEQQSQPVPPITENKQS